MSSKNKHKFINKEHRSIYLSESDNRITWLDSKEAAEYLRISVGSLRAKISRGQIKPQGRVGRTLRFRREELDRLMEASLFNGGFQ